jgi:CheY-like chemotaxis protein
VIVEAAPVVLLVDDEEFFRMTLRAVLTARIPGVEVREASDGREALEVLERERIDCVVSDLVMPGMQGTNLLAELITRQSRVPVIVVSAYATVAPAMEGALTCLPKPVDLDLLCATVARTLAGGAAGQVTLMGLLHVLACRMGSFAVEVKSRGGGVTRRGTITMKRGSVTQARASIENGAVHTRLGLDAAADILGWDAPEVTLSEERVGGDVPEAHVEEALTAVFAYAIARRRAATARRL